MFEVAEYKVSFYHERFSSPVGFLLASGMRPIIARTVCRIWYRDDWGGGTPGEAWCSAEDQFNKETGRKIALTRALKNAGFDKPARSLFWEAYFKKRGRR